MFLTTSLTTLLLLVVSVATNPIVVRKSPVSLSLTRHFNITSGHDLVKKDLARAKNLVSIGKEKRSGIVESDLFNVSDGFAINISVGEPPNNYTTSALLDMTIANTCIGLGKKKVPNFFKLGTPDVFASGPFLEEEIVGTEFTGTLTLNSKFVIANQSICVASGPIGNFRAGGLLGFGPDNLTRGTLSQDPDAIVPTVLGNLLAQGIIKSKVFSLSFDNSSSGELTLGGTDPAKFTGSITYTNVTTTPPASGYWGIDMFISYGTFQSTATGILDSGTDFLLLSADLLERYVTATGASLDADTGLYSLIPALPTSLQSLFFTIAGVSFEFTANAQIWPRSRNSEIGGTANGTYLVVSSLPLGVGFDFVMGYLCLQRFYTEFDATNGRVGFANTPFTTATTSSNG